MAQGVHADAFDTGCLGGGLDDAEQVARIDGAARLESSVSAARIAELVQIRPGAPSRQISSTSSSGQTKPRSDSSLVRPE
jgi:hypothetical protein